MYHYTVAHYAHLRIAADLAVLNIGAGNSAYSAYLEGVPYAYAPKLHFLVYRLEQALHGVLYILYGVVYYAVKPDVNVLLFGKRPCAGVRPYVKAYHNGVGGRCEYNV